MVGEAVSTITPTALTLGGALGPLYPPPADFCLYNMGLYELGIAADVLPPLKPG